MTSNEKVEALIEQAAALPVEAQTELVNSLLSMRVQFLGLDDYHDADR